MLMMKNPIEAVIERQGCVILDGGLASTLECRGYDLNEALWSAKVLLEDPAAIRKVHLDFLMAGADCITSSTYQASLPGFRKRGLSDAEGIALLQRSVTLALEARKQFMANASGSRVRPLVAAGVGPYGAFLADGSEYTGNYAIDAEGLYQFHRPRWSILSQTEADLLACETIPSQMEAHVLLRLLRETPQRQAWFSFSCRDGSHLCDGTPMVDVAGVCDRQDNVAAIGINCTSPVYISELIGEVRKATAKPIIIYPNSGEPHDSETKTWSTAPASCDLVKMAARWMELGARAIGGCCRVGPEQIARLRSRLLNTGQIKD